MSLDLRRSVLVVHHINFDRLRSPETRFLKETGFLGTRRNLSGQPLDIACKEYLK
jgi:hypothetical protein